MELVIQANASHSCERSRGEVATQEKWAQRSFVDEERASERASGRGGDEQDNFNRFYAVSRLVCHSPSSITPVAAAIPPGMSSLINKAGGGRFSSLPINNPRLPFSGRLRCTSTVFCKKRNITEPFTVNA